MLDGKDGKGSRDGKDGMAGMAGMLPLAQRPILLLTRTSRVAADSTSHTHRTEPLKNTTICTLQRKSCLLRWKISFPPIRT